VATTQAELDQPPRAHDEPMAAPTTAESQRQLAATARAAWHEEADAGTFLTGTQLAARFPPRSPRWGRKIARQAQAERNGMALVPAARDERAAGTPPGPPARSAPAAAVPASAPEADGTPAGEDLERPHWSDLLVRTVVALVALGLSYGHMLEVALLAGEPVYLAWAWPLTVDGLAYAALRRGETGKFWLAVTLLISVSANVVARFPETAMAIGPFISAWPPLALYGTHRLMSGHRR
jgi:hypothetical protein